MKKNRDNKVTDNMDEDTITVVDAKGFFAWTVKKSFLQILDITKPENATYSKMLDAGMQSYLHNMKGPAIKHTNPSKSFEQWFINGKELSLEEVEKLKHDLAFRDKFENALEDKTVNG